MKKAYFDLFQSGKDYLSGVTNAEVLDSIKNIIDDDCLLEEQQHEKLASLLKTVPFVDLNQNNYEGVLPLPLAFALKKIKIAKLLLAHGADIDLVNDEKNNLLMMAIADCHDYSLRVKTNALLEKTFQTIADLIELGSNINHKNSNEETPLQLAICMNVPIIPFLLEKGATLEVSTLRVSNSNRCLYFAINNGDLYVLRLLLERNASATTGLYYLVNTVSFVNFDEKRAYELFFLLLEFGANINQLQLLEKNYKTKNTTFLGIRLSLIQLMLEQGAKRIAEISIDDDWPEHQKNHITAINQLMTKPLSLPSLKQLCVMSFFNNPKQCPADKSDLPQEVANLLKEIGEEPDTSTLFFKKTSNTMSCLIQ